MDKRARGERNNNPGNIRLGDKWQGLAPQQTDNQFCQFISPEYGIRALFKVLQSYQSKYKLKSITEIINRYAPPNENNTSGYIQRVSKELGIDATQQLNTKEKRIVIVLSQAIINIELGYQPYSADLFERAWTLL